MYVCAYRYTRTFIAIFSATFYYRTSHLSVFSIYALTIPFYIFRIISAIICVWRLIFRNSLILMYKDSQFLEFFSFLSTGNRYFFQFLLVWVNSNYISINITNLTYNFFISKNITIKIKPCACSFHFIREWLSFSILHNASFNSHSTHWRIERQ